MASLADLKRKIGSVKNTQKITKAMKLVSASKYSKALAEVSGSKRYFAAFQELSAKIVVQKIDKEINLLRRIPKGKPARALVVAISTDRGLCGGLNANLFKKVDTWFHANKSEKQVQFVAWGRKASKLFARRYKERVNESKSSILEKPSFLGAKALFESTVQKFLDQEVDEVYLAYPKFISAISQEPTLERVLPFSSDFIESVTKRGVGSDADQKVDYSRIIFDPSLEEMVERLLERQLYGQVYAAVLESRVCEHGARMSAMDSATRNADEVIKKVTLQYNRARQASITKELIEIVSGAEAL